MKQTLCLIISLLFTVAAIASENTNHTLITGTFGVAWIDGDGIVRLHDGETTTTPVPEVKVYAILAADLLEEGSDQLIYLDDARKALHVHSFKTGTTIGPFGHDVRTMAVGRCSAGETFPSLVASTFSGSAYRWTKEIMGGGWHPVPGTFSHVSRGRFDQRSDLDDFAVVTDGNVYIYSTKWNTYSLAVDGKNIVAVLAGNFTTAPGDEIAMLDKDGNVFLYQNRKLEDLGVKATCLAVWRNPGVQDNFTQTDYLFTLNNEEIRYYYDPITRVWDGFRSNKVRTGNEKFVASNIIGKNINGKVLAVRDGDLYEIFGNVVRRLSVPLPPAFHVLTIDDKPLARYRFGNVPFKPYIDELWTPSGKNVLRDAPWDHLHHHALMYAIRVNGCNFWEEANENSGKQISLLVTHPEANAVESELDWNAPGPKTLLKETRKISVDQKDDVTLLDWRSNFTAVEDAVLTGAHYNGLGLRFLEEMDTGGRFFSDAGNVRNETVRGDEQLTRCRWMAYTANLSGAPVTVAVFDHPSNPVPMTAFTMGDASDAFAYLAATMNLHRVPINLKADETFAIKYRVAVWDGEVSPETVEARYREFVQ